MFFRVVNNFYIGYKIGNFFVGCVIEIVVILVVFIIEYLF